MAKSPAAKTNGHTVPALKAAAAKKAAAPKPAVKKATPAAKGPAKPAAKPVAKPAAKAVKPAFKAAPKPAAKPAARPPAKPAAKPAAKVARAPAAKPVARPAPAPAPPEAPEKVRKAKLVRDSFTMPEQEYAVLGQVKKACIKAGFEIKKSELLRIGVALISQLDLATLQNVLASLPQLKTGRPKND
ncbi:MAG: hypothetical protein V4631_00100 [Pseudomonadota bacterium]